MKILEGRDSINLSFDERERTIGGSGWDRRKGNWKEVVVDIAENLFLMLISFLPIIFFAFFKPLIDVQADVFDEIFINPDCLLLPIPYLVHCLLLVSIRPGRFMKRFFVGLYVLLFIISIFLFVYYKLFISTSLELVSMVTVIWCCIGISIFSGSAGSFISLRD